MVSTCLLLASGSTGAAENPAPDQWRADKRIIDLHMHIDHTPERLSRAVEIMDDAGIGIGVNLSGGIVTADEEGESAFERHKKLSDQLYPQRFVHYMNLDYSNWDDPDFSEQAVKQIEKGHRLGAAGVKIYKRLGLYLKDAEGNLVAVDDPKLDPVWKRCGELGMPVSIHTADPKAFWEPYNEENERWAELKDHKSWWFGDPEKYPSREALLLARNRVIARHPDTTFVCLHFANNPEDIDQVAEWLEDAFEAH
jgi:predicted TIM-barrel fold metal-dependent hydrolase